MNFQINRTIQYLAFRNLYNSIAHHHEILVQENTLRQCGSQLWLYIRITKEALQKYLYVSDTPNQQLRNLSYKDLVKFQDKSKTKTRLKNHCPKTSQKGKRAG